ncbi:hypothetical protein KXX16_002917 [Aspergillus fumigatus]|nr:hypothetical protein CNMCM8689_004054 [Aspergillus fumigatus]KAH1429588.1 hypothetical protein KXX64_006444 [Aspergillus fumigatus]KAH1578508.1 hypothetical protein KXX69_004764 [Aspergillus fumigatus]KAH1642329.1 hypothetical protein KXX16_002917 [Aspergillus fumigatus]KAH1675719.1 hypothetical protein KXX46_001387 [Aspergillus fumigatus]
MSVANLQRDTAFQVRSLFRSLLRQSSQFPNYNFREYARRRTRDAFREHQHETEERRIQELIQDGLQNLRMLKRQTVISQFYQLDKLVVEGQKTGEQTGQEGGIVRQKDTGSSRSGRQFGENANRTRTGQIDHDVFEGLPVRRWTRQRQTISQVPKTEISESLIQGPGGKQALPEHPMPRDSHLLTPMSRALLRAARAGCIYIRKAQKEPEDEEKEATDVEEQPMIQSTDRSFTARKWAALPRHMEPPEVEFLAKRRPGLPSLYGASTTGVDGAANNVPMRRTRFKKVDPVTGNISIYEAWVPEGHKIEGEITDEAQVRAENKEVAVIPEAPAPGTVVEGVGVVNAEGVVVAEAGSVSVMTPPKRRPPPPKRKAKGFGKGRRKKVMFAPGDGADAALVHGSGASTVEGATDSGLTKPDPDASRLSVDQSGQDDEEEEGDEGEESDEGDESMLDAKTPETPLAQPESVSAGDAPSISDVEVAQESSGTIKEENDESQSVAPEGLSSLAMEPSTHTNVQPSAPSVKPPSPQAQASRSAEVSAPALSIQPEATVVSEEPTQAVVTEDVVMSDAQPPVSLQDDSLATVPQQHSARLSSDAQEVTGSAHESPVTQPLQDVPQTSGLGPSPPVEGAHRTDVQTETTEKSVELSQATPNENMTQEVAEAGDVVMEDSEAVASAPATEPIPLRETMAEQAPSSAVKPQPADTERGSNEVDLLGSLEASLGGAVRDAQTGGSASLQTDAQVGAIAAESTSTNAAREVGETVTDGPLHQPSENVEEQHAKESPEQIVESAPVAAEQKAIEQLSEPSLEPSTMSIPEQPEQEMTEPTAETVANDTPEELNQEAPTAQPRESTYKALSAVDTEPVAQPAENEAPKSATPQVIEPATDSSIVPSTEPSAEAPSDQSTAPPTDQQPPGPSSEPHAEKPAQASPEQSTRPTEPLPPSTTEQTPTQPTQPSPEHMAPPTESLTPPSPEFEQIEESSQDQPQNQAPVTDIQKPQPAPLDKSQTPEAPSAPAPSAPEITEPPTQPSDAAPSDNDAAPQPVAEQEKAEPESKEGGEEAPAPSTSDLTAA